MRSGASTGDQPGTSTVSADSSAVRSSGTAIAYPAGVGTGPGFSVHTSHSQCRASPARAVPETSAATPGSNVDCTGRTKSTRRCRAGKYPTLSRPALSRGSRARHGGPMHPENLAQAGYPGTSWPRRDVHEPGPEEV